LAATIPSQFQPGTEDFTSQITAFKRAGDEIVMGVMDPPDFTNFWKQSVQQGFKPKFATVGKALLFPQSMEALGSIGYGLTTEVWWTPSHPFKSEWLGETPQQFADDFTKTTGKQWTQPLLHFIVFEGAVNTLKRTKDVDDKESILEAVKTMKMDTIAGPIDFTAEVIGATTPFQVGPCHIVENVYKTPLVGGQWVKGTDYAYDLTIVSNAGYPGIDVQGKVTSLV
jgi:branched-chain amino acid transport system substrate-binding protein